MIGDHVVARRLLAFSLRFRQFFGRGFERAEKIGFENRVHALHHAGDAFESHAGIDRRFRQFLARAAIVELLVLHEHEIPEFKEAIAVLILRTWRAAEDVVPAIDKDFRAGTARAGVTHRPEIIRGRDADDLVVAEARDLLPKCGGFIVIVIDGDEQLIFRQRKILGDQRPRSVNRAFLEIVAERKVAEHLEEREMARGVADIVEVVVLAASANALLARRRAWVRRLCSAGEVVLELDHARVGEEQGRIVLRDERGRTRQLVAARVEEVQKLSANVVDAGHLISSQICVWLGILYRACERQAAGRPGLHLRLRKAGNGHASKR